MSSDGPRVLVTGASGSVGAAVLRELLPHQRAGRLRLRAASRSQQHRTRFEQEGIEPVELDYAAGSGVAAAMAGVDRLFLCTGYTVDMLVHSKVVLDAARAAGVRQVVHLGALAPPGTYLAHFVWHDYVETYIERQGFQFTHLRPRAFMQNVLSSVRPRAFKLPHFSADGLIAWIDADDIARVAAAALLDPPAHAGKVYPLAEDAMTMEQVAGVIREVTGLPYEAQPRDPESFLPTLLKAGMEPTYAASLAQGTLATARGQAASAAGTYDTVRAVTGRPGVRWTEFARLHRDRFGAT